MKFTTHTPTNYKYDIPDGYYWARSVCIQGLDIVEARGGEIWALGWDGPLDGPVEIGDRIIPPDITG
jgi:hypothetical protein